METCDTMIDLRAIFGKFSSSFFGEMKYEACILMVTHTHTWNFSAVYSKALVKLPKILFLTLALGVEISG
jgi:hypothetical protein